MVERVHKANKNVIVLKFAELMSAKHQMLGMPPRACATCGAIFSHCNPPSPDGKSWFCIFCKKTNGLRAGEALGKLTNESVCYLLPDKVEAVQEDDIRILFIVDKSGSMGRTDLPDMEAKSPLDVLTQFIQAELKKLMTTNPKSKVGLIFFNDNITVVGDGCSSPLLIKEKAILYDKNKLREAVAPHKASLLGVPLQTSIERLLNQLKADDATNQTALGPAMVVGLELLRGGNPGSKMYIFTDGIANIGVGNLETEETKDPVDVKLYEEIATLAREIAVEVSLFKLAKQACKMEVFGPITKETYGQLMEVTPAQIAQAIEFQGKRDLLGRNAETSLRLPMWLKYRLVLEKDVLKAPHLAVKRHGQVHSETKDLYQFVINPMEMAKVAVEVKAMKKVPFQATMKYIGKDNKLYMIVLTKELDIIHDKGTTIDCDVIREYVRNIGETAVKENKFEEAGAELDNMFMSLLNAASEHDSHMTVAIEEARQLQENMKQAVRAGPDVGKVRERIIGMTEKFPRHPKPSPDKPRPRSPK